MELLWSAMIGERVAEIAKVDAGRYQLRVDGWIVLQCRDVRYAKRYLAAEFDGPFVEVSE